MELVNTGRRVRNPLQHKGFRRFQNCRHRPQQTRKYQVRTRLEISLGAIPRGFESLPLRQIERAPGRGALFISETFLFISEALYPEHYIRDIISGTGRIPGRAYSNKYPAGQPGLSRRCCPALSCFVRRWPVGRPSSTGKTLTPPRHGRSPSRRACSYRGPGPPGR